MTSQLNCGFGPTIIRKTPGLPFSPDIPPAIDPSDSSRAAVSAFRGVSSGLPGSNGFFSFSRSKSAWLSARKKTETPWGCPPAAMAEGWFGARRGAKSASVIGRGSSTVQTACFSRSRISSESWNASPSSLMNSISTGALGFPSKILRKLSRFKCLARILSRTCSSLNSASFARAFASAMLALALEIASSESRLASAQCSSLTSVVLTMTNVEMTPPSRLTSKPQLAMVPTSEAVGRDISEKGHILIPDWFYVAGILAVVLIRSLGWPIKRGHLSARFANAGKGPVALAP